MAAGNPNFATTRWSVVLAAGQGGSPDADAALATLCRSYWYPLYAFVRRKGYGICIDGLTARSFSLFDREQLGFDLFKLYWDDSLQIGDTDALAAAIKAAGTGRVILAHCDNERAIDHGHALGITMFQGRYVDQVLSPGSRPRN